MLEYFIINLQNRPEKLIHTYNELRKITKFDFVTRVEAETPDSVMKRDWHNIILHKDAFNNIRNPQNTNILPNWESVACFFSHYKIWKRVIESNLQECIIIEDDIQITDIDSFLMDYNNFINTIKKNYNEHNIAMFITFNSKKFSSLLSDREPIFFNNLGLNGIKFINAPFCGTHFYYINNPMAKFLIENIKIIKYQLDIELGILAKKKYNNRLGINPYIFCNIPDASITQSEDFKSDIQYHSLKLFELKNILFLINSNFSEDICKIIYDFIPNCFKIIRKNDNNLKIKNDYKNMYDFLDQHSYHYRVNY